MGGTRSAKSDAALPTATVVVPTYNRPAQLLACLATLAALDYPRERYEVVVVNDGGVLPDEGGVAALRERLRLTIVAQPNAGPAAARNRAAAHAGGEILAFTDDDCAPESGWLRGLAARLTALPAAMVGGRTVNALAGDPCAEASQLLIDYLYAYYGRPGSHRFFCSNNFAVGTPMFREIGGFDAGFARAAGEDRDLCDRWAARGWEMVYAPEAVVRHAHAMTLGDFARQHFAYGRGAYPFRQARARRGQEAPRVEPLGFYARLVAYPFAAGARWRAPRLAALLAVAQAANAAGFMYEKRRRSADVPPDRIDHPSMVFPKLLPLGIAARTLDTRDEAAVATFCRQCSTFFTLVTGEIPSAESARRLLESRPPDVELARKHVIGFERSGVLVAMVDLLEGYPGETDWYVGLLLLSPEARSRGLGAALWEAVETWIRTKGGRRARLIVQEQNPGAARFWRAAGFTAEGSVEQRLPARTNLCTRFEKALADGCS